jgi:hypothetical protein
MICDRCRIKKLQPFSHDIPGYYAQQVKNLRVEVFDLTSGTVKHLFFTHGNEIDKFEGIRIRKFVGTAASNNASADPLRDSR